MEFRTLVSIPPQPDICFGYTDGLLLLGSCFAEEVGKKLSENKFKVDINPFGTLYNPASIARAIRRLLHPEPFTACDLFAGEGVYHSWDHHSRFSSLSPEEALEKMNGHLLHSAEHLRSASRLIITFGTAFAYRLKSSGAIVANCHKLPDALFERERLSIDAITADWKDLLTELWDRYPSLRLVFTLSPIRHWKDGAQANQRSKATLLLAIDALQTAYPGRIAYFPAYEIMMDELRDYRFYADDMLHPTPLAVEYIWQQFRRSFLDDESQSILSEWQAIQKAIRHQAFQPQSEAYKRFITQTLLKAERLSRKFPYFDLSNEIALLRSKVD